MAARPRGPVPGRRRREKVGHPILGLSPPPWRNERRAGTRGSSHRPPAGRTRPTAASTSTADVGARPVLQRRLHRLPDDRNQPRRPATVWKGVNATGVGVDDDPEGAGPRPRLGPARHLGRRHPRAAARAAPGGRARAGHCRSRPLVRCLRRVMGRPVVLPPWGSYETHRHAYQTAMIGGVNVAHGPTSSPQATTGSGDRDNRPPPRG